jgi:hypothetical protein
VRLFIDYFCENIGRLSKLERRETLIDRA